mgnify:CR=1 FL=1
MKHRIHKAENAAKFFSHIYTFFHELFFQSFFSSNCEEYTRQKQRQFFSLSNFLSSDMEELFFERY